MCATPKEWIAGPGRDHEWLLSSQSYSDTGSHLMETAPETCPKLNLNFIKCLYQITSVPEVQRPQNTAGATSHKNQRAENAPRKTIRVFNKQKRERRRRRRKACGLKQIYQPLTGGRPSESWFKQVEEQKSYEITTLGFIKNLPAIWILILLRLGTFFLW